MSSDNQDKEEKITKTLSEKIPPSTEKLIEEAETATKADIKVETKVVEPNQIKQTRLINEVKMVSSNDDIDPVETKEWLDSLSAVLQNDGSERAHFLIKQLIDQSYKAGSKIPHTQTTPYVNTIPPEEEKRSPGDLFSSSGGIVFTYGVV